MFLWYFDWCFCGVSLGVFVAIHLVFLWHSFKKDSLGVAELNLRHQGNPYLLLVSLDGVGPGVISVPGLPKCASIGRVRVARGSNLSIFRP